MLQSTYALTIFRYTATINGKSLTIDFWDTAGQERFNSLHPSYYDKANACVLVFDVTRKDTYVNLPVWFKELQANRKGVPTLVVANKIDMNPRIASKPFQFPEKHGLPKVRFCSAADGTNVVALFDDIVYLALQHKRNSSISRVTGNVADFPMQPSQQLIDEGLAPAHAAAAAAAAAAGGGASAAATAGAGAGGAGTAGGAAAGGAGAGAGSAVGASRMGGEGDDLYADVLAALDYFDVKDKDKAKAGSAASADASGPR